MRANWRMVIVGSGLIVVGAVFFYAMSTMAAKSNDPAELMRTVGQVSGAAGGIGVVMILFGLLRRRPVKG